EVGRRNRNVRHSLISKRMGFRKSAAFCATAAMWIAFVAAPPASAQVSPPNQQPPSAPATPVTNVSVDSSEAMFTTMCALLAAGFEADVSAANWHPLRARLREQMQHQNGPAVDALRQFYKEHSLRDSGATLSRYIWFGL